MKYNYPMFELAFQTNISIDLLHVCISRIRVCRLKNVIQMTSEFSTGLHCVPKCMALHNS